MEEHFSNQKINRISMVQTVNICGGDGEITSFIFMPQIALGNLANIYPFFTCGILIAF